MSEVYQPREGLGIKDPKFTPRVDAEERAEELGLPDPGTILQSAQQYITETILQLQTYLQQIVPQ